MHWLKYAFTCSQMSLGRPVADPEGANPAMAPHRSWQFIWTPYRKYHSKTLKRSMTKKRSSEILGEIWPGRGN